MEFLNDILAALASSGWRQIVGGVLCLIGGLSTIIAGVGVLRFPDFYTRLHAASVTDTLGALTLLVGMAFLAPGFLIVFKLALIGLFMTLTSPVSSHAIANAAYTAGLEPLIGRFTGKKTEDLCKLKLTQLL